MNDFGNTMPSTWRKVEETISTHDGVMVVSVGTLRDISGYGRLGIKVREYILKHLRNMGIKSITHGDLPNDAHANVILYKEGTPAGDLIDLVESVAQGGRATETTADELRRINKILDH